MPLALWSSLRHSSEGRLHLGLVGAEWNYFLFIFYSLTLKICPLSQMAVTVFLPHPSPLLRLFSSDVGILLGSLMLWEATLLRTRNHVLLRGHRFSSPRPESASASAASESLQSCPTLEPCSPPGSSVHGILQARTLEWVAVPSSPSPLWSQASVSFLGECTYFSLKSSGLFLRSTCKNLENYKTE